MAKLRAPGLPDGPMQRLSGELHALHRKAGFHESARAADATDGTPVSWGDDVTRAFADREDAVKQAVSARTTRPINSSKRPWAPPHATSPDASRNLGRCLYFLYVDAGTPTFGEAIAAMGLAPNTRETLRKNFMRPENFSLSKLHKFVRALSEMAPYQDPEHMVPVITALWNSRSVGTEQ